MYVDYTATFIGINLTLEVVLDTTPQTETARLILALFVPLLSTTILKLIVTVHQFFSGQNPD